tara:strand:+ start:293 stop:406 length:114 start_codon:yes stop_codon:yes gene_type:complete
MKVDGFERIEKLYAEDKFKKIRFSPDPTDVMSDFSDK